MRIVLQALLFSLFLLEPLFAGNDSLFSVSGNNIFDLGRGSTIPATGIAVPKDYLSNSTDFRLGLKNFFVDARFRIDAPNEALFRDPVAYRAWFSRRAIGFRDEHVAIRAGSFETMISHGLSLSLREDLITNQAVLLDGILFEIPGSFYTVKALAGQPLAPKSTQGAFVSTTGKTSLFFDNLQNRDLIMGLEGEITPLSLFTAPDVLRNIGITIGVVSFQTKVDSLRRGIKGTLSTITLFDTITVTDSSGTHDSIVIRDTAVILDTATFYFQNQSRVIIPALSFSLGAGMVDFKFDHALYFDEKQKAEPFETAPGETSYVDKSLWKATPNQATYAMLGLQIGDISLTGEYKNYWYFKDNTFSATAIKEYLDPPKVLYSHSWQLLSKHVLPNYMYDVIGYQATGTWNVANTILSGCYNYGGAHKGSSATALDTKTGSYYEVYLEAIHQFIETFTLKAGIDYGKLEPDRQHNRYLTAGLKGEAGPFGDNRFTVQAEFQQTRAGILAESDTAALLRLLDPATVGTSSLYSLYEGVAKDRKQVNYRNGYSIAINGAYRFSNWFLFDATYENIGKPDSVESRVVVADIAGSISKGYLSFGLSWRPFVNHELRLEAGEFSGGKRCNTGVCVELPPFRGVKVKLTSAF